jgi:membrane associated rhomboid family serine protease
LSAPEHRAASQAEQPSFWAVTPRVVTWLMGAILAAYLAYFLAPNDAKEFALYHFSVIPARFDANGPAPYGSWFEMAAPLIGHVFMHGGWIHLGMNLLVMAQGAPFVAARLGGLRFLLLFFVSGAAGALAYVLIHPGGEGPMVGASGAICGVFGAYFLAVRPTPRAAFADPRVRNAIFMFLLINVVLAGVAQMTGFLPIAWQAHLGGFMAGAALYPLLAPRVAAGPWSQA